MTGLMEREQIMFQHVNALWEKMTPDAMDEFVTGARAIQREFPDSPNRRPMGSHLRF